MADTIRVRIAVVIDGRGDWGAAGASKDITKDGRPLPDSQAEHWARDVLPDRCGHELDAITRLVWVEVDVPVPTIDPVVTVKGEVVADDVDTRAVVSPRVAYFGSYRGSGHVLHGSWWGNSQNFKVRGDVRYLDLEFLPHNQRHSFKEQIEGVAWLTHTDEGLTVLSFWDRSGDERFDCNSAFIVDGVFDFETAVRFSKSAWPSVWARFTFTVTEGGRL